MRLALREFHRNETQGGQVGAQAVAAPHPKSSRQQTADKHASAEPPKASRAPSRAIVMRLAAEVDALAAQLQDSRARILDLEARVDIDPLTDVLNRRGFERELKRSLAYVKRYGASAALIYLDLDGFKPVNDRHGHGAGDAVLKAVAAALLRSVRASDVVARIGGDEFAVLLWNVNGANAAAKAAALEAAVYGTPVRWSSSTLVVGASAGVALLGALDSRPTSSPAPTRRCMRARLSGRASPPGACAGKGAVHAMMSGVSWSSMKVMRSRNCSLRFFRRWTWMTSAPGESCSAAIAASRSRCSCCRRASCARSSRSSSCVIAALVAPWWPYLVSPRAPFRPVSGSGLSRFGYRPTSPHDTLARGAVHKGDFPTPRKGVCFRYVGLA